MSSIDPVQERSFELLSSDTDTDTEQQNSFVHQPHYLTIGDDDDDDTRQQEEYTRRPLLWFLNRETLSKGYRYVLRQWSNSSLCSKVVVVLFALLAIVSPVVLVLLFKYGFAEKFLTYVDSLGVWGMLVMCGAIILANTPIVPIYGLLTIMCGFLFKWWALAVVMTGAVIGGIFTFLLCRYLLREPCIRWIDSVPLFRRMKRKLSDGAPWKIGLLIRIAGFGVGFCNAVLAVTSISFPMFLLTLPLGEIKRIFVLCFLGSTIKSIADVARGKMEFGPTQITLFAIEGVIALMFFAMGFYFGMKLLGDAILEEELDEEFEEIEMQNEPHLDDEFFDDEENASL